MAGNNRSPVARFNSSEFSESEIRAQLQTAEKIQSAQRSRQSYTFWHPRPSRTSPVNLDSHASQQDRPESVSTARESVASALDRTFSFDSLSLSQRAEEAARQIHYRDSPVSACHTDRVTLETRAEVDEPCPPIKVYTLKQARKDEKDYKKSLRKQRPQPDSSKPVPTLRKFDSLSWRGTTPTSSPRRAISDPSSRPRELASQLLKKLKGSRSARRPQTSPAERVPHVDEFDSKADLQQYLHQGAIPETVIVAQPPAAIAELPGSIPPAYTPYQSPSQPRREHDAAIDGEPTNPSSLQRASSSPSIPCCNPIPKMMRCDNCQFGIKHEDIYLQCLVCNHGDRIICNACDTSGYSCRHQLIRKRRNFLQEVDGVHQENVARSNSQPSAGHPVALSDRTRGTHASWTDPGAEVSGVSRSIHRDFKLNTREIRLQQREQELQRREKEAAFTEREMRLRLKEEELAAKEKNTESRQNTDFMRSCLEMAVSLGAQFANISRSSSNASSAPSPVSPRKDCPADPYFLASSLEAATMASHPSLEALRASELQNSCAKVAGLPTEAIGFITHGAPKRKVSKSSEPSSSRSNSGRRAYTTGTPATTPYQLESNDEDEGELAPKRPKREIDAATAEGKLYACPYCKFDPLRYSDRNTTEKHYRGCSSGYWTDISRLKQHLYRVHWQNRSCTNCWITFKSEKDLEAHSRQATCETEPCPCPEKFDRAVYDELHKKRPKASSEEVWFIMYSLLFPGADRPSSPYTSQSSSLPVLAHEQNRQSLVRLFEARLAQNVPNQPGISPEIRSFVLNQLWASMADFTEEQQVDADQGTPADVARGSPTIPPRPSRLAIPDNTMEVSDGPSAPTSAVSATSSSSSRWHRLSAHRRSFSRPLVQAPTFQAPFRSENQPTMPSTLTSAVDTTPSEHYFNIPTPADEPDGWGAGANSWQEGDEAGVAITTDFDFQLNNVQSFHGPEAAEKLTQSSFHGPSITFENISGSEPVMHRNGIPITSRMQNKHSSEMSMVDSAYESLHPPDLLKHETGQQPWTTQMKTEDGTTPWDVNDESQGNVNWDALNISLQDFMEPNGSWDGGMGGYQM